MYTEVTLSNYCKLLYDTSASLITYTCSYVRRFTKPVFHIWKKIIFTLKTRQAKLSDNMMIQILSILNSCIVYMYVFKRCRLSNDSSKRAYFEPSIWLKFYV